MTERDILRLIEETLSTKMTENSECIKYTFFEIRVKYNLTEEQTETFLRFIRNKLENMHFNVYFTGARYTYNDTECIVELNELLVGVK